MKSNWAPVATALVLAWSGGECLRAEPSAFLWNRTPGPVTLSLVDPKGNPAKRTLGADAIDSVSLGEPTVLTLSTPRGTLTRRLEPGSLYHLNVVDRAVSIRSFSMTLPSDPLLTVPIKLAVDEEQPARRDRWEEKARERVAFASGLFEREFGVRFEIVGVESWTSKNGVNDFFTLLGDLRRKIPPHPARLVIGFTSQNLEEGAIVHLGGTQGPFGTHMLLRERAGLSEPERREVLIHELGHFFGAPHSSDRASVMRPNLGDRQALARRFEIRFDPPSQLILSIITGEARRQRIQTFQDLGESTRELLRPLYAQTSKLFPTDPASARFLAMLDGPSDPVAPSPPRGQEELIKGARAVVAMILADAEEIHRSTEPRPTGDRLMEHQVKLAAQAAIRLPADVAPKAFLLGLGVVVDDTDMLRGNILTRSIWSAVESAQERDRRLRFVHPGSLLGRRDLAQHFFISAALSAVFSPALAEGVGLEKELRDARPGGSGFSFVDLAADLAGIQFARRLLNEHKWPEDLAERFVPRHHLPSIAFPEGFSTNAFAARFGNTTDPRYLAQMKLVRQSVASAPGWPPPQ